MANRLLLKTMGQITFPSEQAFLERVLKQYGDAAKAEGIETLDEPLRGKLKALISLLYRKLEVEHTAPTLPPYRFSFNPRSVTGYEEYLRVAQHNYFLRMEREAIVDVVSTYCVNVMMLLTRNQPRDVSSQLGVAPLYELINAKEVIRHLVLYTFAEDMKELYEDIQKQLNTNRYILSQARLPVRKFEDGDRIEAHEFEGTNKEAVDLYLKDTPFRDLFYVSYPIGLVERQRFEHMHIVASQGHGKTQTLQLLIANDLQTDASVIVLDPHGDMIERLAHIETDRRITIIDPKDAPALNPFASHPIEGSENERIQTLSSVISLYEYFFGELLGSELSSKQGVFFRYLAQLMLSIPGANLNTLIAVMDDPAPYIPQIEKLPPNARNFLLNEVFTKTSAFAPTRGEVKYRLYSLIENPAFDRMFNAPNNALDLRREMDSGGIVLIHADTGFLEQHRASIFGRFFIAKTLQAALQRRGARHPTYLYIDEAWMFFDTKVEEILDQARKFKLGLILAHQRMSQASEGLQSSLNTTALKLVGNVTAEDARILAPSLHTAPEALQGLRNDGKRAEWMFYARGQRSPLKLKTDFFVVEDLPTLSPHEYRERREENRRRLAAEAPLPPPQTAESQEW